MDIVDEIGENLNDKKISALCLIDVAKAFDSVNHELLIKKIREIWHQRISKTTHDFLLTRPATENKEWEKEIRNRVHKEWNTTGDVSGAVVVPDIYK